MKKGKRYYVATHYVGSDGKRKQRAHGGFATKREAQTALTSVLASMDGGTYAVPMRLTVTEFLSDRWLPTIEPTVRPNTHLSYTLHCRRYIIPAIGAVPLQKLDPGAINWMYTELGQHCKASGAGLAPATVRRVHATLHRALRDAQRWGLVMRNVVDAADPPRDRAAGQKDMSCWNAVQARQFLAYVKDDRFHALWMLALSRGLRRGELLGLRWVDVDLDAASLSVRQTLVAVGSSPSFGTPKTKRGLRTIPLDAPTVTALKAHRARQATERLSWGPSWENTGLVFTKENGELVHPDAITGGFRRTVRASGLPPIRLHDLRHTCASLLLEAKVQVKVVSEWLGHSSTAFTMDTYGHRLPSMEAAASEAMTALLHGG